MPDSDDFDLDEQDDSVKIRELRAKAKRADAAEAEARDLRRELNLSKAGLSDLPEARKKALLAVHEGDETPEGFRKTADDLGWAQDKTETEAPQGVPAEEQAALGNIAEATAAAEAAEAKKVTVDDLIASAKDEKELLAVLHNAGIGVNAVE